MTKNNDLIHRDKVLAALKKAYQNGSFNTYDAYSILCEKIEDIPAELESRDDILKRMVKLADENRKIRHMMNNLQLKLSENANELDDLALRDQLNEEQKDG